jgi:hypothetical protein
MGNQSFVEALERFVGVHRECGQLVGNATEPEVAGYLVWIRCPCGARFERWVTPSAAALDVLRWEQS